MSDAIRCRGCGGNGSRVDGGPCDTCGGCGLTEEGLSAMRRAGRAVLRLKALKARLARAEEAFDARSEKARSLEEVEAVLGLLSKDLETLSQAACEASEALRFSTPGEAWIARQPKEAA